MPRLLSLLLLSPLFLMAQPPVPSPFHFKSSVAIKEPVEKVYFYYNDGEKNVADSTVVLNEQFEFKGNIIEPAMATVRIKFLKQPTDEKQRYVSVPFFLEPGTSYFIGGDSAGHYKVKGGKGQEDYLTLKKWMLPYESKLNPLYEAYGKARKDKNKEETDRIEGELEKIDAEMKENVYARFIKEKSNSPVAMFALKQLAGWDIDPAKIDPIFASLPEATRNLPSAVALKAQIETARKTAIGAKAMEFTQADTAGIAVSLSSFRGKYVLVDFWASWCGPCRVENPNVVKAFNQYKDKGFTVLGVSLDRPNAKDKWLKAIYDDNLTWTHVSDLKYWDNEVAKQYGIRAIPQNLLIDPNGVIVGRNLTGKKLEDKLAELIR